MMTNDDFSIIRIFKYDTVDNKCSCTDRVKIYRLLCEANYIILSKKEKNPDVMYILDRCERFLKNVENRDEYKLFLAKEKDNLLGLALINTSGALRDDSLYFNMLYVNKIYRHRGLGKRLVNEVIDYAREKNNDIIFLAHLENILDVETIGYFKQFKLNKDADGTYFIKTY